MSETFTPPRPLNTAVLFLVFNRPDTTARVFEAIRQAKPPRLYVAADGPREGRNDEAECVAKVREIVTAVDWPCEVITLFRDKNLGCKRAVSGAITWFFEHEEQGIILEDDCLPSQSFFWFCEELLERYANDQGVFIISGYNKQNFWKPEAGAYFFSNFGGIWGWASWRRAWMHYDGEMSSLEEMSEKKVFEKQLGVRIGKLRQRQLLSAKKKIQSGRMNSWAYPWGLSRHKQGAIACVPAWSLIENIGFGADGTHTKGEKIDSVIRHEMGFPVPKNHSMKPDDTYDLLFLGYMPIWKRIVRKIARQVRNLRKPQQ